MCTSEACSLAHQLELGLLVILTLVEFQLEMLETRANMGVTPADRTNIDAREDEAVVKDDLSSTVVAQLGNLIIYLFETPGYIMYEYIISIPTTL